MKSEAIDEITGFVRAMRVHAVRIQSPHRILLDTCGTGGDGLGTFNISTLAGLVVAGCGVAVAKHGNRSISSRCGSADLLERLGVRIDVPVLVTQRCLKQIGFAFLYAPLFHPSLKKAGGVRKALGMRTVFNALGPLSNPAGANRQLLGVADDCLADKMVQVLKRLGCKRAYVVCGKDGMDEVSLAGETLVWHLQNGRIGRLHFRPENVGIKRARPESLQGGDPEANAMIARKILNGECGPKRDAVVLNAAFGLLAAGTVHNVKEGLAMAQDSLDSGKAQAKLDRLIGLTQGA
jgi:anthranilate phosphoribosyltransferase